jgi:N-acetylglucosamine-6-phosphate deacetylase
MGLNTQIKVGDKADFVVFDNDGRLKKVVLGVNEINY